MTNPKKPISQVNKPNTQLRRRPPRKAPEAAPVKQASKKGILITVISILAVIAIVAGVGYYLIYVMPFQRAIVNVENDSVKIGYFVKRVLNSSSNDVWATLQAVTEELLIKQAAAEMGLDVVTDEEIDSLLKESAKGDNESITDAEYAEWYRQTLNLTTYTEKEFRDIVTIQIYRQQIAQIMADNVSPVGPQVHLYVITTNTYDDAVKLKARADGGEDFSVLALEASTDSASKEKGGEIGWLPIGILDAKFAGTIAGLEVGKCSEALNNTQEATSSDQQPVESWVLFYISEKSASMEIQADFLETLKGKAMTDWLNNQMSAKNISFHGLKGGGFDSYTSSWVSYQVERLKSSLNSGGAETTTTTEGQ